MTRKLCFAMLMLALALAAGATAALAATSRPTTDPGLTSTSIVLGGTAPLTGSSSAYGAIAIGAHAYVDYVNSRGGVNGRQVEYLIRDDASDPDEALAQTRRLVEQDQVFAVFDSFGTEQNLAVRDYLNQKKVPQLFAASGATVLGAQASAYPYTIGLQPTYAAEGWVFGQYLARTQGAAKVAVLFENDGYGQELLSGLRRGILRSKVKIVAAQPYEGDDVQKQVARLRIAGANVFAVFAKAKVATQALKYANRLGWKPKLTLDGSQGASASVVEAASDKGANKLVNGMISVAFLKDPTDPRWVKDEGMKLYRKVMKRFASGEDEDDVNHVYGMAAAWTAIEAIRKAGAGLTRARLVDVVGSLSLQGNPFLQPGIAIRTGAGDHFPIEQLVLQRWHKGAWRSFGGLWSYRPGG
jgi:branched-chain amino acid transport system substrate-binding protein